MNYDYHPRFDSWEQLSYLVDPVTHRNPSYWWALALMLLLTAGMLVFALKRLHWRRAVAGAVLLGCVGGLILGAGRYYEAREMAKVDGISEAVDDLWAASAPSKQQIAADYDDLARRDWVRWIRLSILPFGVALGLLAQAAALGLSSPCTPRSG